MHCILKILTVHLITVAKELKAAEEEAEKEGLFIKYCLLDDPLY